MDWLTSFLYSQFFLTLPISIHDFTGQTIIISGSNTGLGLEATRHISYLNSTHPILAIRNQSKGKTAKQSILTSKGRPESSIEVWDLDVQSHESIKAFCARVDTLPRLDAVRANEGIMTQSFNLLFGLLPKLKQSAAVYKMQPRLSIAASDFHIITKFDEGREKDIFGALNNE
ncbi:hypothetical protein NHQ30_006089 [Ciborinia camelliae]|nr:hypothetical protein NHQ30_006089 [Ciborinia camelliae]